MQIYLQKETDQGWDSLNHYSIRRFFWENRLRSQENGMEAAGALQHASGAVGWRAGGPGFQLWLHTELTVGSLANRVTTLYLSLLTCKTKSKIVSM